MGGTTGSWCGHRGAAMSRLIPTLSLAASYDGSQIEQVERLRSRRTEKGSEKLTRNDLDRRQFQKWTALTCCCPRCSLCL